MIGYIAASATLVLTCASLAMLDAERHNPDANIRTFGDAVWWAASTMTTVGYGDRVPTTGEGRAIGFALMLADIARLQLQLAAASSQAGPASSQAGPAAEPPSRR